MLHFEILFNDKSLTNIISFAVVASKFTIPINIELDPSINVHLYNITRIIFKKCGGGL